MVVAGFANGLLLAVLWLLYMSFVHVGQEWYGYGWEIQLTRTGVLAIFLGPLLDIRTFPRQAPPLPIVVLFRWLVVRVMLEAWLIKVRGDDIWRNGTALYYHFETRSIPGPLSRWFHFLPRTALKIGVWFNWLAELVPPLFAFGLRPARYLSGVMTVLFQLSIILSSNLSFLNWLTIVPALACFDNGFWTRLLPRRAAAGAEESRALRTTAWVATTVITLLSIQPAMDMVSPGQIMNTFFDPLDLVNTYGTFDTVDKEWLNVVFEGTTAEALSDRARWEPYPYKGLPVALEQHPPQIAPYQLHLDWQMWFATMVSPADYPRTLHQVAQLLHNDPGAVGLFAANPFPDRPPRYIRAIRYRHTFAEPGNS